MQMQDIGHFSDVTGEAVPLSGGTPTKGVNQIETGDCHVPTALSQCLCVSLAAITLLLTSDRSGLTHTEASCLGFRRVLRHFELVSTVLVVAEPS